MSQALETILTLWGPLAMGWVIALILGWYIHRITSMHREDLKQLSRDTQLALNNNTKVLSALNVRLEERGH